MLRAALRSVLAHKLRLGLTILTVTLGIAFVTGTNIFTDSLRSSFDALVEQPRADVLVTPRTELDAADENATAISEGLLTLPATLVTELAGLQQAQAAYGQVQAQGAYVLGADNKPLGPQGPPARMVSWLDVPEVSPLRLAQGRSPQGPQEIALLASTAELAEVGIGDTVRITTPLAGVRSATVTGIVTRTLSGGLGGTLVVLDLPTAQAWFTGPESVTQIAVQASPGVSDDALAAAVSAAAPTLTSVRTAGQQQDQVTQRIEEGFSFLNTFLLAFGLIALFVSTFLIFNTFSMLIAQRTRELALVRAIGATRSQVFGSVLLEAGTVGALAGALGIAGGVGVAQVLRRIIESIGGSLPASDLVIEPSTFLIAAGVGIGVTMLAAGIPAWRASVIPPVAAMRDDGRLPSRSLRGLTILGLLLLVASVPCALLGVANSEQDGTTAATWVGLSALAGIVGVVCLTPAAAGPLLGFLARPFQRRPVTQLALENARRNPRRTSATSSALAIGLALMTAVTVIGLSARASVTEVVDQTIGADFVVLGQGFRPFEPEVFEALRDAPGTSVVTYLRNIPIEVGDERFPMTGVRTEDVREVVDVVVTSGSLDDLGLGMALVDDQTASQLALRTGDVLDATFVNGPGQVRIVGTFEPVGFLQGFIVSMPTLASIGALERDTGVYIKAAPGENLDTLRAELNSILQAYPAVRLQDQADIKRDINQQFDLLFGFIFGMLALSILVAFLGIVNTLSLSVYERIREIGLLRAVGMARRQVRQMVAREALTIALIGSLVGIALGLGYGALFQKVLEPQGITQLAVPVAPLALFAVLGVLGGLAAAIWPAIRAARLRILTAIATQ
jgi:putative ABC transport system permease protein